MARASFAIAAAAPLSAQAQREPEGAEEGERVISREVTRRRVRGGRRPAPPPKERSARAPRLSSPSAIADETKIEEGEARRASGWSAVVEAGTDAPLFLGGNLLVEAPARIRLRLGLGVLSETYMRAGNSILRSYYGDDYPEQTADLVRDALGGSLVMRAHLGARPAAGWYIHGGYSLAVLGAEVSGAQAARAARLDGAYEGEAPIPRSAALRTRVHFADIETGWHWGRGPGLSVRLGVGWSWALASSSEIEVEFEDSSGIEAEDQREIERAGARFLDAAITKYVMAPTLSLAVGFALR